MSIAYWNQLRKFLGWICMCIILQQNNVNGTLICDTTHDSDDVEDVIYSRRHLTAKCYRICMQQTHWQCSILSSWSAVRCHEDHHTPHPGAPSNEPHDWHDLHKTAKALRSCTSRFQILVDYLVPVGAIEGLPSLWSATAGRLCVPATITLTIGPWPSAVFWVFSPTAWNYLPVDLWVFLLSSYFMEKLKLY